MKYLHKVVVRGEEVLLKALLEKFNTGDRYINKKKTEDHTTLVFLKMGSISWGKETWNYEGFKSFSLPIDWDKAIETISKVGYEKWDWLYCLITTAGGGYTTGRLYQFKNADYDIMHPKITTISDNNGKENTTGAQNFRKATDDEILHHFIAMAKEQGIEVGTVLSGILPNPATTRVVDIALSSNAYYKNKYVLKEGDEYNGVFPLIEVNYPDSLSKTYCISLDNAVDSLIKKKNERKLETGDYIVRLATDGVFNKGDILQVEYSGNNNFYYLNNRNYGTTDNYNGKYWRFATDEEIEAHLIKELEKRGIRIGSKVVNTTRSLKDSYIVDYIKICDRNNIDKSSLIVKNYAINHKYFLVIFTKREKYEIPSPDVELYQESLKIQGHSVTHGHTGVTIGCQFIHIDFLEALCSLGEKYEGMISTDKGAFISNNESYMLSVREALQIKEDRAKNYKS